jgi:hydroxymethylpyrimidine/phosphomethylpyrimidine kinase
MSIAGVDPSGGAGIFADFRAIEASGARALGAVTALTVQTESTFITYEPTSLEILSATVRGMADAFAIGAVKTGMLPTQAIVERVAALLDEIAVAQVVIDPVIVASVGARLVDEGAQAAIGDLLVPRATLLTPNMPEAAALAGFPVTDLAGMEAAGRALHERGARAVVVTGGHLHGEAVDVLVTAAGVERFSARRLPGSVHGTGCSFASAAAAALAAGKSVPEAIRAAKAFVAGLFSEQRWRGM